MAADPRLVAAVRAAGSPVAGLRVALAKVAGPNKAQDAGATLRTAFPSLTPQDIGKAFGAQEPKKLTAALTGAFGAMADRGMVATALASAGITDPANLAKAVGNAFGQVWEPAEVIAAVSGNIRSAGVAGLVSAVSASKKKPIDPARIIKAVASGMPQVTTASVTDWVRSQIEGGGTTLPRTVGDVVTAIGDEALSHVGLMSPKELSRDAVEMGKALFSADLLRNGVPPALAGKAEALASDWAASMSSRSKDAISGIVGSTLSGIANDGMSEALARPVAGLMHDAAVSGITDAGVSAVSDVANNLFGEGAKAVAGMALPVVGPLAAGLVSWGLGKLLGDNDKRPTPPPAPEADYKRKLGAGGDAPIAQHLITPSLVLAHLFRACMRWHRGFHPSPVVQFTDWRASPGPIDPTSDAWRGPEGERSKNWGSKGGSNYVRLGPWTPSAYGPAFRLVWSGVGYETEVDDEMRGGLRSVPSAGPAVVWRDESSRPFVNKYRFSHDFLAEFTGAWNQGVSDAIARGIAAAFAWGEDRPHLQRFRPYLAEIGWAEFICSSALIHWHANNDLTRKMALEKTPPEVMRVAMAGSWDYGRHGGEEYLDELYSEWGSDPTGSGLAALCYVTAEIRRCKVGETHVFTAASTADKQAKAILEEDQKARTAAVAALTGRQPPVAMVQAVRARAESHERAKEQEKKTAKEQNAKREAQRGGISMTKAAGIGLAIAAGGYVVARAMRGGSR